MHRIFGERFAGHREPAWHRLGTVFNERLTVTAAAKKAQLDYQIAKRPLCFWVESERKPYLCNDKIALVRDPTPDDPTYRYFGVADQDYGLLQNLEIAQLLDPLSEEWPVETAGALGLGETIFYTLDAGEIPLHRRGAAKADQIHQYFLLTDSHTGERAMTIAFTPVRVVCQNTLTTGLAEANIRVNIRHDRNIRNDVEFRVQVLKQMQVAIGATRERFLALLNAPIEEADAAQIIMDAYPEPRKPAKVLLQEQLRNDPRISPERVAALQGAFDRWQEDLERVRQYRQGAFELYQRLCDEHPHIAGTAWAAWQAVVECEDYRYARNDSNADRSLLFGERRQTKERAFSKALLYAN